MTRTEKKHLAYKSESARAAVAAAYDAIVDAWPVPAERLRLPTREGETHVVACGPRDAPPVVLLHGAQANAPSWLLEVPTWAAAFRLYAVDVIGEPGLSAPSRPPLASDAHARWLDDVLAGLGLARAAFVGVSLGGWLAIDYATRRPERVTALALLCPGGVGRQRLGVFFKILPLTLLGRWGKDRALRLVLGAAPVATTPEEARFGAFADLTLRSARPRYGALPVFADATLARLAMPVSCVVGGRDALFDSADTKRRLEAAVPHAEVRLLPDAGHWIRGQAAPMGAFLARALAASSPALQ
ncbi:MAG: alpha/beta fold hydrolase [Deltaproteobacteria bacterium]|nr:alpha/beta fold hydrolase [Deltaproteobacteria bacterium]